MLTVGAALTLCLAGGTASVGGAQSSQNPAESRNVESAREDVRFDPAERAVPPSNHGVAQENVPAIPSIFAPETTFVQTSQSAVTAQHLIRNVMSPFCPGLSLEACPSPNAQVLRTEIRRSLANGESEAAIRESLVKQYGRAVLGIPPDNTFGTIAWIIPWAALVAAGILVTFWLRRRVRSTASAVPAASVAGGGSFAFSGAAPSSDDAELLKRLNAELARDDDSLDPSR